MTETITKLHFSKVMTESTGHLASIKTNRNRCCIPKLSHQKHHLPYWKITTKTHFLYPNISVSKRKKTAKIAS